ncbi:MAG: FecR domain-containing protein [Pseudomonadota bacterium]
MLLLLLLAVTAGAQQNVDDTLGVHVVKPGETLWDITRYYLGEDFLWKENWRLNPEIKDPNKLRIGQELTIIKERKITADNALVKTVANEVDKNLQRSAWEAARAGDELAERDGVRTRAQSSAELAFNDNSTLRLGEYSQIFLQEKTTTLRGVDRGRIEVRRGAAELTFEPLTRRKTEIELLAGSAVSRPQPDNEGRGQIAAGTNEDDGSARVMVYEGQSSVEAAGTAVNLTRGTGSTVPASGPPTPPEKLLRAPRDLAPGNGAIWKVANQRVRWDPVPEADHYRVEVCRDPQCGDLTTVSEPLTGTDWQPVLAAAGEYFWRVRAVSASGLEGYASSAAALTLASTLIDAEPPQVAVYPGGEFVWRDDALRVAPGTPLVISAYDAGIGLKWLEYRFGDGAWQRAEEGQELLPGADDQSLEVRAADLLDQTSRPTLINLAGR